MARHGGQLGGALGALVMLGLAWRACTTCGRTTPSPALAEPSATPQAISPPEPGCPRLTGGSPPPRELTRLSENLLVSSIASDGTNAFWGIDDSKPGGAIERWTSGGTGKGRVFVANIDPKRIAVGASEVFWEEGGTIRAMRKSGGAARVVAEERYVMALAADRQGVYWAGPDEVRMQAEGTKSIVTLAKVGVRDAMAVDDDAIYVGAALSLHAVDRRTNQVRRLAEGDSPTAIVTDAEAVYWAGGNSLHKIAKRTGVTVQLGSDAFCGRIDALAIDETNVYVACHFVTRRVQPGQGFIARVRKAGGCPETVIAGLDWPRAVGVLGGAIIYADRGVTRLVP